MTRIVYSDLDGTMVGPGGCFFRAADGRPTLEPARALTELLDAGITLVLVSGRTRAQLLEAVVVFGADGFVAELGAVISWAGGRETEVLRGAMPDGYDGTPAAVLARAGLVDALLARYPGRLEYHAPWHVGHEADVMLRGLVDVDEVKQWLRAEGYGWLRLRDNGVLPPHRATTLAADAVPPHVYHLMPAGLSKGLAVARDLARRGIDRADAIAIGDSASDLGMAAHVRELWLTANGAGQPHMTPLLAQHRNVRFADAAVGLGWAQAVRAALAG